MQVQEPHLHVQLLPHDLGESHHTHSLGGVVTRQEEVDPFLHGVEVVMMRALAGHLGQRVPAHGEDAVAAAAADETGRTSAVRRGDQAQVPLTPDQRLWLAVALAERADRDKPLNYEANSGECDDLKQVCVLVGDVVLVKGTIRATGQRVEIRKDPEGYLFGVLEAAPGKLATFRQRRDISKPGIEEVIDGHAERIEYDEKAETVKLLGRARIRLLESEVQRDELRGDAITYDQRNSKYFVTGGTPKDPGSGDGRVRGTIGPRTQPATSPGSPAPLAPSRDLANPRRD